MPDTNNISSSISAAIHNRDVWDDASPWSPTTLLLLLGRGECQTRGSQQHLCAWGPAGTCRIRRVLMTSNSAIPFGALPGADIPQAAMSLPEPSASPNSQGLRNSACTAPRGASQREHKLSRDGGNQPRWFWQHPRPEDSDGTGAAIPIWKFSSLLLPEELLYPNQSVSQTIYTIRSGDKPSPCGSPSDAAGVAQQRAALQPRQPQSWQLRGCDTVPMLLLLLSFSPRAQTHPERCPCPRPVPYSSCITTAYSSWRPQRVILLKWRRKKKDEKKARTQTSGLTKHAVRNTVQMPLKHREAWGINFLSRDPVPVLDHSLSKEMLPAAQSESSMVQLWGIPTCPSLDPRQKERVPPSPHPYHQEAAESNEVTPQSPFFHIRQVQRPQPLLRKYTFQHRGPSVIQSRGSGRG